MHLVNPRLVILLLVLLHLACLCSSDPILAASTTSSGCNQSAGVLNFSFVYKLICRILEYIDKFGLFIGCTFVMVVIYGWCTEARHVLKKHKTN